MIAESIRKAAMEWPSFDAAYEARNSAEYSIVAAMVETSELYTYFNRTPDTDRRTLFLLVAEMLDGGG